ncbi:MAG TPA: hypothetical protein VKA70_16320 [Blastocatellia bacterium]|nr:hypothetical protein [Blastocatellia bacterium]
MKAKSTKAISLASTATVEEFFLKLALGAMLMLAVTIAASAQTDQTGSNNATNANNQPASGPSRETLGPNADSIRPYRPAGRDPFRKALKPKAGKPGKSQRVLGFPALDQRRAEFRQKVELARTRGLTEPDPVQQYLISELDITGVFRDERGAGAFVRAQPTGTMFFVRQGTACYNGEIVRIETDEAETGGAKVMFREVSYMEINGKQSLQERVVAKQPTTASAQK